MRRTEGESLWPPAREQSASRDTGRAVSARRPATISYGTPVHGVDYPSTARVDPRSVTANSKLGDGAGTNFELDDDLVLRMTYERFGTELQFVLAGPNSVSIAEAQTLSTCSCCVSGAVAAMQTCCVPCVRLADWRAQPTATCDETARVAGPWREPCDTCDDSWPELPQLSSPQFPP